jgi:hypothetical protein
MSEYHCNFVLNDTDELASAWVIEAPDGRKATVSLRELFPSGKYCFFDVSSEEFGQQLAKKTFPSAEKTASIVGNRLPVDLGTLEICSKEELISLLAAVDAHVPLDDEDRVLRASYIKALKNELDNRFPEIKP